ncbi:SDR family NAD(P)-dependent oxidoreductase [Pseudonocardia endophytica]|uniref:NAD(P)-dependent dehydrogenase (Short-subunit alcohol dehydrogenase family) n=1 Tax=Pseudonocardia endophytica TaxID=401976 RepID=A0A4R1HLF9_PSEEN|nr:SDR family NAD(P)-dependent oxidoreductase [Pseudonocardia endophytica]TCK21140.1 NAD(P)-dependent dehydrogenase (short-subunit alcohol dehydrogenase family) [Pseudonocardia endophytica]
MTPSFADRVVVVTGAGRGLGRRYALDLGATGARVVVHARRTGAADAVVEEIRGAGGQAVPAVAEVRDGDAIAGAALDAWGRIDALVVNAGGVRDRTFARMTREEFDDVVDVHLGGAYAACSAVWPHLDDGSAIVLTTSGAGMHGNFGQANYAAAKAGVIGLAKSLAIEGRRRGIRVNAVAPMALTDMTRDVFGSSPAAALTPEAVSPVVLGLAHPSCPLTGEVVETGGGWASVLRWERSAGSTRIDWDAVSRFGADADHPATTADCLSAAVAAKEEET